MAQSDIENVFKSPPSNKRASSIKMDGPELQSVEEVPDISDDSVNDDPFDNNHNEKTLAQNNGKDYNSVGKVEKKKSLIDQQLDNIKLR